MEPVVVLSGGNQDLPGGVGVDTVDGYQARVDIGDEGFQEFVQLGDLFQALPRSAVADIRRVRQS
ncbi:hypothetical protein [Actinomadura geliboluensis]|uniref:hypothetical protein n=1 Tax=Actinomadura geliboluensis TaxID=882440 RepID=UPI0036A88ED5